MGYAGRYSDGLWYQFPMIFPMDWPFSWGNPPFSPRWCTLRCSDRGPRTRHVHLAWLHGGARLNGPSGNPWLAGKSMEILHWNGYVPEISRGFSSHLKWHVWLAEGKPNYRLNWYEYDFKLKLIEATDTLENSKFRGFTYRGYPSFLLTYCDGQPNIKPVF